MSVRAGLPKSQQLQLSGPVLGSSASALSEWGVIRASDTVKDAERGVLESSTERSEPTDPTVCGHPSRDLLRSEQCVILPLETHSSVLQSAQPMIGDRYAVSVAR
jgi:hypothetical protein